MKQAVHLYRGDCPDALQPESRDTECEACREEDALRAHLLSQDAEIERLTRENETMRRALETLDAIGHKRAELAESRLAVADALLSRCFVQIGELTKGLDPHDPIYVELQQLSLDWTQHSMRIPPHLSENPHDRA